MDYYNDNDPFACAWLRELIKDGLIPGGKVDERSIRDIKGSELGQYRQVHFFAGIAGWTCALRLAGWPADRPVWTGSCPCQPYSVAGNRKADADERNLWPEMFRLIRECRPDTLFGEQVQGAIGHGWLDGVFADLEGEGYTCGAVVLGAHSVGAPHIRQRLFWVAHAERPGLDSDRMVDTNGPRRGEIGRWQEVGPGAIRDERPALGPASPWADSILIPCRDGKTRRISPEPFFFTVFDGLSNFMGDSWDSLVSAIKKEVKHHAKKTSNRPGEVLRAVWNCFATEAIQRGIGRYGEVFGTEILLIAMCKLAWDSESEFNLSAQHFREIQEGTMRIVWPHSRKQETPSCASHQRGLDGSPTKESQDALRRMPFETTQCEAKEEMPLLREQLQEEGYVSEAFSAVQKIWRSFVDEGENTKRIPDYTRIVAAMSRFPLAARLPGRVGLLRGAGNSIVPQTAAIFIRAFMELEERANPV